MAGRQRQLAIPLVAAENQIDIQDIIDLLIESSNADRIDYPMGIFFSVLIKLAVDPETAVLVPYQERNHEQQLDIFSAPSKLRSIQESLGMN